ncbi:olfactory receptor 52Z1-like [Thalassophryne amazonica]|uniref:olfactory receptor 52Z1-like n=1 Tax=Thalassophryne amazonica TaxID=390379 RepID=UPI001470E63D|nr:olfactory receptor 52Z1-like [Thalassophryne amazonica]
MSKLTAGSVHTTCQFCRNRLLVLVMPDDSAWWHTWERRAMLEEVSRMNFSHTTFVFRGFPELQRYRHLLALPFFVSYLSVLVGNVLLVFIIHSVESLHNPMYLLVAALCIVDVVAVTAIIPNLLLGLLFDLDQISLAGCLTQMFITHFLSSVGSTLLLAMALDRYVAVCKPLRYTYIIDSSMLVKLLLFTLVRSGSVMATLIALAGSLQFCKSNVIQHGYCDHMALVSLACGSTEMNSVMGVAVIVCFVGVDIPLIIFSYGKILSVVVQVAGRSEDQWKAIHTCGTHLMVMMCFYLVGSVTFLSHNLNIPIPTDINTFLGIMYILLPATVNPIIYGVRTREISGAVQRMLFMNLKLRRTDRGACGSSCTLNCFGAGVLVLPQST